MTPDTYCTTVCRGRCCTIYDVPGEGDVTCPQLAPDGSCSIYAERFAPGAPRTAQVGIYRSRANGRLPVFKPFHCSFVEDVIARGNLPGWVAEKCCYARPELLENHRAPKPQT